MKKIFTFILTILAFNLAYSQFDLRTRNFQIVNNNLTFDIYLIGTPQFGLGNSNIRFNITTGTNCLDLANFSFVDFMDSNYSVTNTTGTNTATGLFSLNTVYNGAASAATFIAVTGDAIANTGGSKLFTLTIPTTCTNPTADANLTWRISGANPKTTIVDHNKTTALSATANTTNTTGGANGLIALPIELLSFNGKARGEVNTFRWDVASQANVSHFVVERSVDGINNFREVSERVKAAGTTNSLMTYTADDKNPINLGYYRLKSVDFDGSTNYSNVITIDRRNTKFGMIDLSPNPTNDVVRINFESNTRGEIEFTVTDITGRIVKTQSSFASVGNNNIIIDMADLTVGTYFISMTDGKNTTVEKVVKQ